MQGHVHALADFVRMARRVADDEGTSITVRQGLLDHFDTGLIGADDDDAKEDPVRRLRETCDKTGVTIGHGRHLLQGFKKRAAGRPMSSWGELLTTCQYSAAPIGRFLLDLHGEGKDAVRPTEALCAARQVLSQVETCGEEYRHHGRVVLPADWLRQAGAFDEELGAHRASHGVRIVLDRMLERVDGLLTVAAPLPELISDPGLRRQFAVAHAEAERRARKLRRRDPLWPRGILDVLARIARRLRARNPLRHGPSA